jgi:nucleotide-binding universal stress UspA family protein
MTTIVSEAPSAKTRTAAREAFRTLLVHIQPEREAEPRLGAAVDLARRLDATLYGLGAEMIPAEATTDPYGYLGGAWVPAIQEVIRTNLANARDVFKQKTAGLRTEWLALEDLPAETLARLSRGADLIIAGGSPLSYRDGYRWCDPAKVMLQSGRPVLVVPPAGGKLKAEAVVVAWKDTREARRALADALPFLKDTREVVVMEVCDGKDVGDARTHTTAVVEGLKRHGVAARAKVVAASPDRVVTELNVEAKAIGADLIVAGGYGHSRLGEWAFGGVTYDLLNAPERFVLLSH